MFTDYREIPADIAEKPLNHPVNPCKHLQCAASMGSKGLDHQMVGQLYYHQIVPQYYIEDCRISDRTDALK